MKSVRSAGSRVGALRIKRRNNMGQAVSRITISAVLAAAMSLSAAAATTTWQIDPNHSSAQFAVKHLGLSTVRGAFTKVNGTVELDPSDVSKSSVNVTIDAASVDTRVEARDKDLRSDHFFDVEKYPTITFKSTKVEQLAPGQLKVTGDLTIHGTTKPVVLEVEGPTGPAKDPWGNQRMAATATTKVNRQDYNVKWNSTMDNGGLVVGNDVAITIDVEMITKPAAK
jgi:polyisoprenoid-binding protein YceI